MLKSPALESREVFTLLTLNTQWYLYCALGPLQAVVEIKRMPGDVEEIEVDVPRRHFRELAKKKHAKYVAAQKQSRIPFKISHHIRDRTRTSKQRSLFVEQDRELKTSLLQPEDAGKDYDTLWEIYMDDWWCEDDRHCGYDYVPFVDMHFYPTGCIFPLFRQLGWIRQAEAKLSAGDGDDQLDRFRAYVTAECAKRSAALKARGEAARRRYTLLQQRHRFDPQFAARLDFAQSALSVSLTALPLHVLVCVVERLSVRDRAALSCVSRDCRAAVLYLPRYQQAQAQAKREIELGDPAFRVLPEDLLLQVVLRCDARTILQGLACTSRRMLRWVHREIDWRAVCAARGWYHYGLQLPLQAMRKPVPRNWQQLYFLYTRLQQEYGASALEPPLRQDLGELSVPLSTIKTHYYRHDILPKDDRTCNYTVLMWAHLRPLGAGEWLMYGRAPLTSRIYRGMQAVQHCPMCGDMVPHRQGEVLVDEHAYGDHRTLICDRGHFYRHISRFSAFVKMYPVLRCTLHDLVSGHVFADEAQVTASEYAQCQRTGDAA